MSEHMIEFRDGWRITRYCRWWNPDTQRLSHQTTVVTDLRRLPTFASRGRVGFARPWLTARLRQPGLHRRGRFAAREAGQ